MWDTEVLLALLLLLALLHAAGWNGVWKASGFRWVAPAVSAATGVALATGFFYGVTVRFQASDARRQAHMDQVQGLGAAFGLAVGTTLVTAIAMGIWLWRRSHGERERAEAYDPVAPTLWAVRPSVPPEGAVAQEPNGATPELYKRIGWARALADAGRNGDLLLTVGSTFFVLAAGLDLYWPPFRNDVASGRDVLHWFGVAGDLLAGTVAVAALGFLIYRSRRPGERKLVGIFWEVLTFFPRRYHPLAVRPYAERAVPELLDRLAHHVADEHEAVVLSAHSQGSVIAYAALLHLYDDWRSEVAFVTYGCPLRHLYGMAFPAYFTVADFEDLRKKLWSNGDDERPWRSFYHLTDYIAKTVFEGSPLAIHDVPVPDPAQDTAVAGLPLAEPMPVWPDPRRTAWLGIGRHSHYREELAIRKWVGDLRCLMGEPDPPCGAGP